MFAFVAPLNVEVRGVDDGQLLVEWQLLPDAPALTDQQGFRLQLDDMETTVDGEEAEEVKSTLIVVDLDNFANQYTFKSLKPYNSYRASVSICNKVTSGAVQRENQECGEPRSIVGKTLTNSTYALSMKLIERGQSSAFDGIAPSIVLFIPLQNPPS